MMPQRIGRGVAGDVFTAVEVARATGVPRAIVDELIRSGQLQLVPGTRFISGAEVMALAPVIRAAAAAEVPRRDERPPLGGESPPSALAGGGPRWPVSVAAHAMVLAAAIWMASLWPDTAPPPPPAETARLVFLVVPGPGGGGGGGGVRAPAPPTRAEHPGTDRAVLSVPPATSDIVPAAAAVADDEPRVVRASLAPVEEPPPAPLPSARLIAPVAGRSPAARDREGAIDASPASDASRGSGAGGGAGTGEGTGSGPGTGGGLGPGDGGGTGGGVYRPGSGIDPPRLLREIKALYTEDARRRGITGDVLLEVVVTREGGVGDVRVLRGLDAGLDARAIDAVRQWRFAPARRLGEPVDVLVEVAVEFSLR